MLSMKDHSIFEIDNSLGLTRRSIYCRLTMRPDSSSTALAPGCWKGPFITSCRSSCTKELKLQEANKSPSLSSNYILNNNEGLRSVLYWQISFQTLNLNARIVSRTIVHFHMTRTFTGNSTRLTVCGLGQYHSHKRRLASLVWDIVWL